MLKNLILFVTFAFLFLGCTTNTKPDSAATNYILKANHINQAQAKEPLTDSAKLVKHLDSLTTAAFPYLTEDSHNEPILIDLSEFKNRKLLNLPLRLRYREIGACVIDDDDNGAIPSTLNLTDSAYKAKWLLLAKTPKYIAILTDRTLVTLTYDLKVIDAMHVEAYDRASNNHFQGGLSTTVTKDLKLKLEYYYNVQVDEERNFDSQVEDDIWLVDNKGRFKIKRTEIINELKASL